MTAEHDFVKNQDRKYFNIYTPMRLYYDDQYPGFNTRVPLTPESEADRQTGSGTRFRTQPYPLAQGGASPMANNYDPSVKAPVDRVYEYSPEYQYHQPVMNKIKHPVVRQNGAGPFAPLQPSEGLSPAINNWRPAKIPEPMRIYEYSSGLQLHSRPSDPIIIQPKRGALIQGRLSDDDMKPMRSTAKYYNSFIHVPHNPLIYKN